MHPVTEQSIDVVPTALVAVVASVTYIATSLARRDRGGARLWALAFLFALGGALVDVVITEGHLDGWTLAWVLALGNAFVVSAAGCFLLGSLAYRRRSTSGPSYLVGSLAILASTVTLWTQQSAQQWPGRLWTLLASALFAGAVCYQWARRDAPGGVMRSVHVIGFAVWAASDVLSGAALLEGSVSGPLGAAINFLEPWLAVLAGTLVAVSAFALRESIDRGRGAVIERGAPLSQSEFLPRLRDALRRAAPRLDAIAVIGVRVEGIGRVRRSFGAEAADGVDRVVQAAVSSFSSPLSIVCEADQPGLFFVATTSTTPADARRQAGLLYRGVVSRLVADSDLVVPEVGVGVALSSLVGYSAETLMDAAARAADSARASDDSSVVIAVPPTADASSP